MFSVWETYFYLLIINVVNTETTSSFVVSVWNKEVFIKCNFSIEMENKLV